MANLILELWVVAGVTVHFSRSIKQLIVRALRHIFFPTQRVWSLTHFLPKLLYQPHTSKAEKQPIHTFSLHSALILFYFFLFADVTM